MVPNQRVALQWGQWVLDPETLMLTHDSTGQSLDLELCRTGQELTMRLFATVHGIVGDDFADPHVADDAPDPHILGDLVRAVEVLFQPSSYFWGGAEVDPAEVVQEYIAKAAGGDSTGGNPAVAPAAISRPEEEPISAGTCAVDAERFVPFRDCADPERPGNVLTPPVVAYSCGWLGWRTERVDHDHDPAETDRCRALADEAFAIVRGMNGIGGESSTGMFPYFATATGTGPKAITEAVVRAAFGNTVAPQASVTIIPLKKPAAAFKAALGALGRAVKRGTTPTSHRSANW